MNIGHVKYCAMLYGTGASMGLGIIECPTANTCKMEKDICIGLVLCTDFHHNLPMYNLSLSFMNMEL